MLYHLYGHTLKSNISIPGPLEVVGACPSADVEVVFGPYPPGLARELEGEAELLYASPDRDLNGRPRFEVTATGTSGYLHLQYAEGVGFVCSPDGQTVYGRWWGQAGPDQAALYLLGPVLGFVLQLRGIVSLHASCVAQQGNAFAVVGSSGAGKSTTAAHLVRRGYSLVSDDVLPVLRAGHDVKVAPGYPRLRLWNDAVAVVFGGRKRLPSLLPGWNKCYWDLGGTSSFASSPPTLRAVYALDYSPRNRPGAPIKATPPLEALSVLTSHIYKRELLRSNTWPAAFHTVGALAAHVPVYALVPPWGPDGPARTAVAISNHYESAWNTA